MTTRRTPAPLAFKPDLVEAARRWDAFYAGEMIDRPVVCVTAPREGRKAPPGSDYYQRACGDMDDVINRALAGAEATFFGGEAVPSFYPSFGPDEVAVFCGAPLCWSRDSGNTNWSRPFVEDWEEALPLKIQENHPLWQRMLALYRRAAERMAGKMALSPLDLHTNMDLLAPARGPERLCVDCIERPDLVDRAMESARAVFPVLWKAITEAGRLDELGYCHGVYSMEGAAYLQCDFSCMISPAMFDRWVLPALEEEAEIVRRCVYHWDGPGALVHTDSLTRSRGLHCFSYVPGAGRGGHVEHLELLKEVQRRGKAVQACGSPDEVKHMHRHLAPDKVFYSTGCTTQAEAEKLLKWFVKNT